MGERWLAEFLRELSGECLPLLVLFTSGGVTECHRCKEIC